MMSVSDAFPSDDADARLRYWSSRAVLARERYHVVSVLSSGVCGTVLLAGSVAQSGGERYPSRLLHGRKSDAVDIEIDTDINTEVNAQLSQQAHHETLQVLSGPESRKDDDCVVIKAIPKNGLTLPALDALRELTVTLYSFRHRYINRLIRHFEDVDCFYHVFEYLPGGDLYSRLEQRGRPFTEQQALFIVRQVLDAVSYIHERGFTHRDIKLENLVFKTKPQSQIQVLQLIDFDLLIRTPASGHARAVAAAATTATATAATATADGAETGNATATASVGARQLDALEQSTSPVSAASQSVMSQCTQVSPGDTSPCCRARNFTAAVHASTTASAVTSRTDARDEYGSVVDDVDLSVCTSTVWATNPKVHIEPYESPASSRSRACSSPASSLADARTAINVCRADTAPMPSPQHMMPELVGTILYVSPEIAANQPHVPEQSDMWAVGVLFYSLIAFCMPFQAPSSDDVLSLIQTAEPDFSAACWQNISAETIQLISVLLSKHGRHRPTAAASLSVVKDIEARFRNYTKDHKNGAKSITPSISVTKLGRRISFSRSRVRGEKSSSDAFVHEKLPHILQPSLSESNLVETIRESAVDNRLDEYADTTGSFEPPEIDNLGDQEPRRAHSVLALVRAVSLGFRRRHGDNRLRDSEVPKHSRMVAPDDTDEDLNPIDNALDESGESNFADSISNSFFRPKVSSSALAKIADDHRDVDNDHDSASRGSTPRVGGSGKFGRASENSDAGEVSFRGRSAMRTLLRAVTGSSRRTRHSNDVEHAFRFSDGRGNTTEPKPNSSLSARRLRRASKPPRRSDISYVTRLHRSKQPNASLSQSPTYVLCELDEPKPRTTTSSVSSRAHSRLQPSQQQAAKEASEACGSYNGSATLHLSIRPVSADNMTSRSRQKSFGRSSATTPAGEKRTIFRISRDWSRYRPGGREDRRSSDIEHISMSKCRHSLETTAFFTKDFVPVPEDSEMVPDEQLSRTSRIRSRFLPLPKGPRHAPSSKRWRVGGSGSLNMGQLSQQDPEKTAH